MTALKLPTGDPDNVKSSDQLHALA